MMKLRHLFKKQTKRRRIFDIAGLVVGILVFIGGVVVLVNGIAYAGGGRSLFGTKDTYEQSQTLRFGDLDLRVTKVTVTPFTDFSPEPQYGQCDGLSTTFNGSGRISLEEICRNVNDFAWTSYEKTIAEEKAHAAAKNKLTVYVGYTDVADQSLDMSKYTFKLVANDEAVKTDASPQSACRGISRVAIISGSEQSGCLTSDITKGYAGPLRLIVKKDGKEKSVKLGLPENK